MMTDFTVGGRTTAEYIRGALYGLAAVTIWSGWIVVARLGLKSSLTPWDIAALRFGVAVRSHNGGPDRRQFRRLPVLPLSSCFRFSL
jgi:drug/metabolite transporter (DMT)-like permease